MTLAELPEERLPGDEIAPGFLLRVAVPTEYEAIAALDGAAFGDDACAGTTSPNSPSGPPS